MNGCDICKLNVTHTKMKVIRTETGNDWKWKLGSRTENELRKKNKINECVREILDSNWDLELC